LSAVQLHFVIKNDRTYQFKFKPLVCSGVTFCN